MKSNFIKTVLILVLSIYSVSAYAQIGEDPFEKMMKDAKSNSNSSSSVGSVKINADAPELFGSLSDGNVYDKMVPLEGAVNPLTYIVGPNDLFNLGLYGYVNQQVPIYVSPEGSLIIPTVGEVKVSGLTLSEAKARVVSAVKKRFYSSDVSFTLATPRTFLVKVTGKVQGTFQVLPIMRVSELLKRLYFDTTNVSRVYTEKIDKNREQFITQISLRNIQLVRKDGSVENVDIYKFFHSGNDEYNPFFLEGDLLKIPNTLLEKNYVTIDGAVQLAGTYEYSEGDDLEMMIALGRGFDINAEPDSILLFRPYGDSKRFETLTLSYEENKNFKINNFDRVFVKYKTDYQKKVTVLIVGEIERPGYYPVTFKNTRLKDVIEMAGGFNENAYLPLSIVFRTFDKEYTQNRDTMEIRINERANDVIVSDKDKANFWSDILSRRGRVIVAFEKLYKYNDNSQNIVLEDGDVIYINDNKNIVYVYGQVQNEGYIPYKIGEEAEYYVDKAGGYALAADEGNTRIIKFNSRGWYRPGDIEIQSGDFIYVPKVSQTEFKDWVSIVAQITGALVGIATAILIYVNNR